jgi:phage terminase small subunit
MPDKPLTAKQASFVQYYADPGSDTYNNATNSAIKAGYEARSAKVSGHNNITAYNVKQAINGYKTETAAILDHNRQIAIDLLNENITMLDAIILDQPLNVAAVTARTGAIRELNSISMLHGSNLVVASDAPADIPAADLERVEAMARQALKLA